MVDDNPWQRRIVICCDGTWQSSVSTSDNVPSNVTKLCRHIARIGFDKTDPSQRFHQLVYYDSGVCTGNLTNFEANRQGGTGAGLAENVIEAYNFIVNNFEPGDEIFCFGFSRGAYTARAVAGLVTDIGVISPIDMQVFPQVYRRYMMNDENLPFRQTQAWLDFVNGKLTKRGEELKKKIDQKQWTPQQKAEGWEIHPHEYFENIDENSRTVKVVGVWDTVGSLGIPDVAWFKNSSSRAKFTFHNVALNKHIRHAYHALALDERREAFGPTLWYISNELREDLAREEQPPPELRQVWFPGVHINIGGGSDDCFKEMKGDLEHMATTSFVWMLQCIAPHITINQDTFVASMDQYQRWCDGVKYACTYHHETTWDKMKSLIPNFPFINNNPGPDHLSDPKRDPPHNHLDFDYGWGSGNIVDSFAGIYRLAKSVSRIPGQCKIDVYDAKRDRHEVRPISEKGHTHEYIHPICRYRDIVRGPEPGSALKSFTRKFIPGAGGRGLYRWFNDDGDSVGIPEWVILEHADDEFNYERYWYNQCKNQKTEAAEQKLLKALETDAPGHTGDWLEGLDERVDFGVGKKEAWDYP